LSASVKAAFIGNSLIISISSEFGQPFAVTVHLKILEPEVNVLAVVLCNVALSNVALPITAVHRPVAPTGGGTACKAYVSAQID